MPDDIGISARTIGTRIQELRAIRGFSLTELGRRAHVSAPQLSRIETGKRYASPAVLASVARALGVGVSVLHGQPYIHMLQKDKLDALLQPIGTALGSWDIPPEDEPQPRGLEAIERHVSELVTMRVRMQFSHIAELLPGLISEAILAAQVYTSPGRNHERAHAVLAEVARTAAIVAYRLGYMDLARLALARMDAAAPRSGDPRQVAVERYERAQMTHAESSRPDRAGALMRAALRDLDDDGTPATQAVRGTLQLRAAMMCAVQGDRSGAEDWLGQADELAEQIGERRDYAMSFGPLKALTTRMAVLTTWEDHAGALACAAGVHLPDDYPPPGRAGWWLAMARAQTWAAHHEDALHSLHEARREAPQLTRYHPGVHEMVGTLLRARRQPSEALRQFAKWSGI